VEGMQSADVDADAWLRERSRDNQSTFVTFAEMSGPLSPRGEKLTADWECGEDCEVIGCVVSAFRRGSVLN
jgi:hypothetical protein